MTERFPIWCRSLYLDMGFTLVEPGTSVGVKFGFRLKDWLPDSFIARQGNMVILPLLTARHPGTGTFSRLLAHRAAAEWPPTMTLQVALKPAGR